MYKIQHSAGPKDKMTMRPPLCASSVPVSFPGQKHQHHQLPAPPLRTAPNIHKHSHAHPMKHSLDGQKGAQDDCRG